MWLLSRFLILELPVALEAIVTLRLLRQTSFFTWQTQRPRQPRAIPWYLAGRDAEQPCFNTIPCAFLSGQQQLLHHWSALLSLMTPLFLVKVFYGSPRDFKASRHLRNTSNPLNLGGGRGWVGGGTLVLGNFHFHLSEETGMGIQSKCVSSMLDWQGVLNSGYIYQIWGADFKQNAGHVPQWRPWASLPAVRPLQLWQL